MEFIELWNASDPFDADLDSDRDGVTNRAEYLGGTDPMDTQGLLGLSITSENLIEIVLTFRAVAGNPCLIWYRDAFGPNGWR
jgi:hypothetical protein